MTVTAPGVLDNDSDTNCDGLTAVIVSPTANGTLVLNSDGSITYTPNANFHGTDSFTYCANDGTDDSEVATVTITVKPVNDAPGATDDIATTTEDTAVTINVLANDDDIDGDPLALTGVTNPDHGTAGINPDGTMTYTAVKGYSGTDSFSYTISDIHGATATATVTVTIEPAGPAEPVSVDHLVKVSVHSNRYDRRTEQSLMHMVIKNTSDTVIEGPIWVVIRAISDPTVTLSGANGATSDGYLYIDVTSLLPNGRLDPGKSVKLWLAFHNPLRRRFTFMYNLRGLPL